MDNSELNIFTSGDNNKTIDLLEETIDKANESFVKSEQEVNKQSTGSLKVLNLDDLNEDDKILDKIQDKFTIEDLTNKLTDNLSVDQSTKNGITKNFDKDGPMIKDLDEVSIFELNYLLLYSSIKLFFLSLLCRPYLN